MMYTFYVLAWFICSGSDPCHQQTVSPNVFADKADCQEVGRDLIKHNPNDAWEFQYPRSFTCAPSRRWIFGHQNAVKIADIEGCKDASGVIICQYPVYPTMNLTPSQDKKRIEALKHLEEGK